jgi:hypothetical protein
MTPTATILFAGRLHAPTKPHDSSTRRETENQ